VAADKGNNLIPTGEDDLLPKKRTCLNDNNSEKASRNIELVHIIDNQQKNNMQREMDTMRTTSTGNDEKGSIPAHQLELSLRRTDYGKLENQDKNDRRTLNHSTSSAFSL
jgi:pseudo-response regulator 5